MHRGWLSRLRCARHVTARVLAVALLLPALLSLLPQTALSAAAQLEQDLARAICSTSGKHASAPMGQTGHEGKTSCALCGTCASAGSAGLSAAPDGAFHASPVLGSGMRLTAQLQRQHLPAPLGGSPPRGPPAI